MAKTATIRARIEPELKAKAEKILTKLGLTQTELITLLYEQVVMQRGLPFAVKVPNRKTREAIRELEAGEGLGPFASIEELRRALDS